MNVITVSKISKKYFIGQQVTLSQTLKSIFRSLKNIFVKKQVTAEVSTQSDFWALKDVSFELQKGEILGIIGTNGSGKSTLLKILSRVTTPTEGNAQINGRVSSLLEVGTGFNPELTGRENVFLNGALLGLSQEEIQKKFDQIVEFSGVGKFIDTPIKRYSSGMTVRLGFSVAAFLDSEIMIIDEVLAVGDADFQRKSFSRLNEIRRQNKSILFVSHSMDLVANLCQRVLWLHLGEVKQIGKPQDVIQSYLNFHEKQRGQIKRHQSSDGDGTFPFVSELKMLDANKNVTESIHLGEKAYFVGTIEKLSRETESHLSLYIWIENQNGLIVSELNTDWKNQKFTGKGLTEFTLEFPQMTMAPGLYTVNLELKVNFQRADYSLQIFNFFVVASDFYQSGVLPQTRGQFFLDFNAKVNPLKESVT